MTMLSHAPSRSAAAPLAGTFLSWIAAVVAARRSRQVLANLEPHMLDDIGVTARDAHKEAHKPLWDVPTHWTH